mmetsp:Transcript_134998/g.234007  ORF Transcript_134998/g.234007 Transcript_134998/m.234007 type:complete len:121 (+) Transcript_134998:1730-2092(+)
MTNAGRTDLKRWIGHQLRLLVQVPGRTLAQRVHWPGIQKRMPTLVWYDQRMAKDPAVWHWQCLRGCEPAAEGLSPDAKLFVALDGWQVPKRCALEHPHHTAAHGSTAGSADEVSPCPSPL